MNVPSLSQLVDEYNRLLNTCIIDPKKFGEVDRTVDAIEAGRPRYTEVMARCGVPWYVTAVIHQLECGGSFKKHLHNGDLLTARTWQVPAGRPVKGNPPFEWEYSAVDALQYDRLTTWSDWTFSGTCYKLEGYNGWGTRVYHNIPTPYLWSYSNHYTKGKYVADGKWSTSAVSQQPGAAVLLIRMAQRQLVSFTQVPQDLNNIASTLLFMTKKPVPNSSEFLQAAALQAGLNKHPGIFVRVDGWAGRSTSDAVKAVFGFYLHGDPNHANPAEV